VPSGGAAACRQAIRCGGHIVPCSLVRMTTAVDTSERLLHHSGMVELSAGCTSSVDLLVCGADLASALVFGPGDEGYAPVFSTPRMVALMEVAAARIMVPCLMEGETSVGSSIAVEHFAASPLGSKITAVATYAGREGNLFCFEIIASDEAGEVGRAIHKRAVVSLPRLLMRAQARRAAASE
jgi:fluoroacetyl-CoA thioesterase